MITMYNLKFPVKNQKVIWNIYNRIKGDEKFTNHKGNKKMKVVMKHIHSNLDFFLNEKEEKPKFIKYPSKVSKEEIQAVLFANLKFQHKLDARLGVNFFGKKFDLVIFRNKKPFIIIFCSKTKMKSGYKDYHCYKEADVETTIKTIVETLKYFKLDN